MQKRIVSFERVDGAKGGPATIEVEVVGAVPEEIPKILRELLGSGAVLTYADSKSVSAVFKAVDQTKLLELLDAGWSFEGVNWIPKED